MPPKNCTNKAARPALWTIHSGGLLNDDSEDSDFPSNQDTDDLGSSSDLDSIVSSDNEIITEGHARAAKKAKEACEAKAHAAMKA
jgi:hypothetical protein